MDKEYLINPLLISFWILTTSMGVSGSGKSTIGPLLASRLNVPFKDADHFHPESNVRKMESGTPLTDSDREPWLEKLNQSLKKWRKNGGAVLACSALKKSYRKILKRDLQDDDIIFIHLDGEKKLIAERLKKRSGHYMPASLLQSQFDALEQPQHAISVCIEPTPQQIVDEILSKLVSVASIRKSFELEKSII